MPRQTNRLRQQAGMVIRMVVSRRRNVLFLPMS